jgi:hypothetical protein
MKMFIAGMLLGGVLGAGGIGIVYAFTAPDRTQDYACGYLEGGKSMVRHLKLDSTAALRPPFQGCEDIVAIARKDGFTDPGNQK